MGRMVLGFLAGFLAGAALTLAICAAVAWLFDIPQTEGAYAMGVAFFWMPAGSILGGLSGAIAGYMRR